MEEERRVCRKPKGSGVSGGEGKNEEERQELALEEEMQERG